MREPRVLQSAVTRDSKTRPRLHDNNRSRKNCFRTDLSAFARALPGHQSLFAVTQAAKSNPRLSPKPPSDESGIYRPAKDRQRTEAPQSRAPPESSRQH